MNRKNILVITYWSFDDALIQTYTLPYVRQIRSCQDKDSCIFLFTLANKQFELHSSRTKEIDLEKENIFVIQFSYHRFGLMMLLKFLYILPFMVYFVHRNKIKFIHAWCTPGGAIAYLLSLFTKTDLILDSFEPHAESMLESKTWKKFSFAYRVLFYLEKQQLLKAKEVICTTSGMIEHSKEIYGITKPRYFIKPAGVDMELFDITNSSPYLKSDLNLKEVVCVYVGKFGGLYLDIEVFDFFKTAFDFWKNRFSVLLLSSQSDKDVKDFCIKSGLPYEVVVKKFVPHYEIPKLLALGSFAICPIKPMPSKNYCSPIKNGEYWAMGLPIVITKNISVDSELVQAHNLGYVLQSLDKTEYQKAIEKMNLLFQDITLKARVRKIAEDHRNITSALKIYQTIYG